MTLQDLLDFTQEHNIALSTPLFVQDATKAKIPVDDFELHGAGEDGVLHFNIETEVR